MAPRKLDPKPCACGCGETTKTGQFLPGHDQKLRSAIEKAAGGLLTLKEIIEKHIGQEITSTPTPKKTPERKVCPECGHNFAGKGWEGIDEHWKSKHKKIMPYSEAWPLIETGRYKKQS